MAVNKYKPTQEELDYFDYVQEVEPPAQDVSRLRSLLGSFGRGVMESAGQLMRAGESPIGPDSRPRLLDIYGDPQQFDEPQREAIQSEALQESLKDIFPTQEGRFAETALERGGKILPFTAAGGPGAGLLSNVMRSVLGGFTGQSTEELGGGPFLQALAEGAPFALPSMTKKIPVGAGEEKLAAFARSQGMTEEELALALEKKGLKDELAKKFASKGEKLERALDSTYQRLGDIWDNLSASYGGTTPLKGQDSSNLINKMSEKLSKMPAEVQKKVQKDFNDFLGTQMTGENIMDFWKKMNYYINKGDGVLGTLKSDLIQAAEKISPEFGKDFRLANKLYSNFKKTAVHLKPSMADKLLGYGEGALIIKGILSRDMGLIQTALGAVGGRKLAQDLVTNPRLQQLSNSLTSAINRNKPAIASRVLDQMRNEIGKSDAESAKKIAEFDIDQFFE